MNNISEKYQKILELDRVLEEPVYIHLLRICKRGSFKYKTEYGIEFCH